MFFNKIFRKNNERRQYAPWAKWLVLIFLLFIFAQALLSPPKTAGIPRTPVQKAFDDAGTALREQKTIDFKEYKNLIFPEYQATLRIKEVAEGKGPISLCGQKAAIAYQAMLPDGKPINDSAKKTHPLTFHIGTGETMPALEQGISNMRVGGQRKVFSSLAMTYGIEKFKLKELIPSEQVLFDVELLSIEPVITDESLQPFKILQVQHTYGSPLNCGEEAHLNLIIWDVTGKKLYSTESPETAQPQGTAPAASPAPSKAITVTPGKSEVFMGLEQGIIGMTPGSVRTLVVPPAFQKTMFGGKSKIDFPLPGNQTVLVDVQYLP